MLHTQHNIDTNAAYVQVFLEGTFIRAHLCVCVLFVFVFMLCGCVCGVCLCVWCVCGVCVCVVCVWEILYLNPPSLSVQMQDRCVVPMFKVNQMSLHCVGGENLPSRSHMLQHKFGRCVQSGQRHLPELVIPVQTNFLHLRMLFIFG